MRNVQNETAREASVAATPVDPDLTFTTEAGTTETYVDDWAPGENRTFTYRFDAAADATPRASTLEFDVEYRDAERADATARTVRTGVTPALAAGVRRDRPQQFAGGRQGRLVHGRGPQRRPASGGERRRRLRQRGAGAGGVGADTIPTDENVVPARRG